MGAVRCWSLSDSGSCWWHVAGEYRTESHVGRRSGDRVRAGQGFGYATESLQAMVRLAQELEIRRLFAFCHSGHSASMRVLEKAEFRACPGETELVRFPNLKGGVTAEAIRWYRGI